MVGGALVEIGLFPCAPYRPNLAVDINVLDFVRILFVNISPNVRAWCKASEEFLLSRNQKLNYSDNMRKRFGAALLWYTHLYAQITKRVDRFLDIARQEVRVAGIAGVPGGGKGDVARVHETARLRSSARSATQGKGANASASAGGATQPKGANASTSAASATQPKGANASTSAASVFRDNAGVQVLPDPRPSSYLARRCPSCFEAQQAAS
ncbi:hypothetical protein GGG16DRAFT_129651 [Schizophyllum commune]